MHHRSIPNSGLKARTTAVGPSDHHRSPDLTVWRMVRDPGGCRCTNLAPLRPGRAIRLHAVGAAIPGHDVSGTGWQILDDAMQSIITMVPIWQSEDILAETVPSAPRITVAVVSGRLGRRSGRCHADQLPPARKLLRTMAVAEEAEVPDAVEPVRQHMDQEATDEFVGRERHRLLAIVVPVILPVKADLTVIDGHQAVVGDSDTVGVPGPTWSRTCIAGPANGGFA